MLLFFQKRSAFLKIAPASPQPADALGQRPPGRRVRCGVRPLAIGLVLVLWWASAGLLDRQVEAAIRADAQGLAERWDEGGLPVLI